MDRDLAVGKDEALVHVGLNSGGKHRVDADALLAEFHSSGFRQTNDRVFAGDVLPKKLPRRSSGSARIERLSLPAIAYLTVGVRRTRL